MLDLMRGRPATRKRGAKGIGLVIAVAIHLLLLVAVLRLGSRVPSAPPDNNAVVVYLPMNKPDTPKPPPPPPPPKAELPNPPPLLEPPIVVTQPEPAPQVAELVAPPVAVPAPAPAPAAGTGTAEKATPAAPAGSAVGSTKLVEDCADAPDRMLVAEVYRLPSGTSSVKAMNRRKPLKTVCLAQLNIAPRYMGLGIAGLDMSEWFGLDIRFTLNVPQEGSWDFVLLTDDGSVLYVDDERVIDNDGLHGADAVMGTVSHLTKGVHNLRVRYFQGPGDGALMLGWKKSSDAEFRDIPQRLYGRPPAAAPAQPS
jgi:hypothetical protein